MLKLICRALACTVGDRLLDPWAWTARIGPEWDTFDVQPWNLYNLWWRFGQWVFQVAYAEPPQG